MVMRRLGHSVTPWLVRVLAPLVAVGLLFVAIDLHLLLHPGELDRPRHFDPRTMPNLDPAADAATHGDHHPEPAHLDDGSVDLRCPACLFGPKSQNKPTEAPNAITRPGTQDRLAAVTTSFDVTELAYRLPLSRAPPLS